MSRKVSSAPAAASELGDVLAAEHNAIAGRRGFLGLDPAGPPTGLALSGGGTRSATFCLGFLQALAQAGLIGRFDYLSSVSGGGFVAGWWIAWLSRDEREKGLHEHGAGGAPGRLFPEEERIDARRSGACSTDLAGIDPLKFLRIFSNYLTPRMGAFSADVWRAVAVVTRNLVLTWLTLLPVLFAMLCFVQLPLALKAPRIAGYFIRDTNWATRAAAVRSTFVSFGIVIAAILTALTASWMIVSANFGRRGGASSDPEKRRLGRMIAASVGQGLFLAIVIFCPAIAAAVGWKWGLNSPKQQSMLRTWGATAGSLVILYAALNYIEWFRVRKESARAWLVCAHARTLFVAAFVTLLLAVGAFGDLAWRSTVLAGTWGIHQAGGIAGIALAIGSALFSAVKSAPAGGADVRAPRPTTRWTRFVLAISPTLVIALLAVFGAWLARGALEFLHEDVARAVASWSAGTDITAVRPAYYDWVNIGALAGAVLCLVIALTQFDREGIVVPAVLVLLLGWFVRERIAPFPRWAVVAAIAALLVALATGLLYIRAEATPRERQRCTTFLIAVCVALLVTVVSAVTKTSFLLQPVPADRVAHARDATVQLAMGTAILTMFLCLQKASGRVVWLIAEAGVMSASVAILNSFARVDLWSWEASSLVGLGGTALMATLGLGWMVDPNLVSLHGFYRARLVRAYLGASNRNRAEKAAQVTDSVLGDDLRLADVHSWKAGGPYPLINTALNLVATRDLGVIQRRSANFTLSPFYCGSTRTGYRPTDEYMSGAMTLGTALAISGAAASPAMGSVRVSAAQSMLLTLLNIRLGFWAPNPGRETWRSPQARLWTFYTLLELVAQTDATSSYCYLTDGGHFDNTGIYSLVQRACRVVVVVDCGHDPRPPALSDLGHAIRICRIDFGAEIALDIRRLVSKCPDPFVVGTISYSPQHLAQLGIKDPSRRQGSIIWVKPSIWKDGEIAADVRQYARAYEDFPQQGTGDQWYDEAQFESYRKLGVCAGQAAAGAIASKLDDAARVSADEKRTA